jgi:uncharacterized protein YdaU (DUF1376 family)
MTARPWMPLHVGDYLGDTGHLRAIHHGAYLLLIMHYWRTGGLPDDDEQLQAIARVDDKEWPAVKRKLVPFFRDGWHHKRIDEEIAKQEIISTKRAIAGQKGGFRSGTVRAIKGSKR